MKKITPFLLGLGLTLIMVGGFLSSSPKDVGAATVVSLGKNGTSEYLLYPTDTLSAYTFIATSTTASSSFANGINLTGGCFSIGSVCLPTASSLASYLSLSSWYSTTTDGLDEGLTNLYFTNPRVQTFLDTISKGYFFSTTSADAWDSTKSRWSTTSNTYWLTQQTTDGLAQGSTNKYFANSLVDTWLGTKNLGVFWSTTSADAWHLTKTDVAFSTTSADYWISLYSKGFFFSSTSADYWLTTKSLTSASSTLLGDTNTWSATNQFAKLTFTNATGTGATTTNFAISSVASKILLTNATGGISGYAGASCTNQFVRSLSALGAATCATVGAADVSLANLTATNGTLTFSGTYNGATARTIGLNLANANTWTGGQIFGNSTTTSATTTNSFVTNETATNHTVTNLNVTKSTTTNATSTTGYFSGVLSGLQSGFTGRISPVKRLSYITATSTAWTATTSGVYLPPIIAPFAGTIQTAQCSTDAGTLNVDIYHTTTHLTLFNASTTVGTITFSSNNTVTNGEKMYISAGTPASSPTVLSCTLSLTESL